MYDKLKEITCDGIDYYYNTGAYTLVFDPTEGGKFSFFENDTDMGESALPFELLEEFITFANFIKMQKKTITKDFKKTIKDRIFRDLEFKTAIMAEALECMRAGDVKTADALLIKIVNATIEGDKNE